MISDQYKMTYLFRKLVILTSPFQRTAGLFCCKTFWDLVAETSQKKISNGRLSKMYSLKIITKCIHIPNENFTLTVTLLVEKSLPDWLLFCIWIRDKMIPSRSHNKYFNGRQSSNPVRVHKGFLKLTFSGQKGARFVVEYFHARTASSIFLLAYRNNP